VLDFGLVKMLEEGSGGERFDRADMVRLTASSQTLGTPAFMAPEQVRPGASIDHRADIYSLACVAYFAVTGKPVFEGRMDAQLMFAHLHSDPDSPSTRLGAEVDAGLEAVIMKSLAKDPDHRHQTMGAMAKALKALRLGS
jgi:serine/threonine-protein kinase